MATTDDIFEVYVVEAKNVFSKKNSGYARLKANFTPQQYKSVVCAKSVHPHWGQAFRFFTSENPPTGNVLITIHERGILWWDTNVGQVVLDVASYANGEDVDFWLPVQKGLKMKNGEKGEVHLRCKFFSVDPDAPPPSTPPIIRPSASTANIRPQLGSSSQAGPSSPSSGRPQVGNMVSGRASETGRADSDASVLSVEDKYELIKELGRGAFATVYKAKNRFTDEEVAIKIVNKTSVKEKELEMLTREIKIIKKLKHPYIVRLLDLFDGPKKLYIVLELVPGGELFDRIVKNGSYSEEDARNIIRQVLEGVAYMHSHGVVHRDLKPENLLCMDDTRVKIADFGMSKDEQMGKMMTAVGTPSYIAPEIIKGLNKVSYDSACDIWSIGILSYVLLCGFTPFWGDNQKQLFEKITKAEYEFPSPEWDSISGLAKEFIRYLLTLDPTTRPSAQQCLDHDWIKLNQPVKGNKLSHATKNLAIMQTTRIQANAGGYDSDEDDNKNLNRQFSGGGKLIQ